MDITRNKDLGQPGNGGLFAATTNREAGDVLKLSPSRARHELLTLKLAAEREKEAAAHSAALEVRTELIALEVLDFFPDAERVAFIRDYSSSHYSSSSDTFRLLRVYGRLDDTGGYEARAILAEMTDSMPDADTMRSLLSPFGTDEAEAYLGGAYLSDWDDEDAERGHVISFDLAPFRQPQAIAEEPAGKRDARGPDVTASLRVLGSLLDSIRQPEGLRHIPDATGPAR